MFRSSAPGVQQSHSAGYNCDDVVGSNEIERVDIQAVQVTQLNVAAGIEVGGEGGWTVVNS